MLAKYALRSPLTDQLGNLLDFFRNLTTGCRSDTLRTAKTIGFFTFRVAILGGFVFSTFSSPSFLICRYSFCVAGISFICYRDTPFVFSLQFPGVMVISFLYSESLPSAPCFMPAFLGSRAVNIAAMVKYTQVYSKIFNNTWTSGPLSSVMRDRYVESWNVLLGYVSMWNVLGKYYRSMEDHANLTPESLLRD